MSINYNVLVIGQSGSGKTTAARNLDPSTTAIICTDDKPLPFPGAGAKYKTVRVRKEDKDVVDFGKSNYLEITSSVESINLAPAALEQFAKQDRFKVILYDTFTHPLINYYMGKVMEDARGNEVYKKFNKMGFYSHHIISIMKAHKDKMFILNAHPETSVDGTGRMYEKMKTVGGKLTDEKVDIPSSFTIVLNSRVKRIGNKNEYVLETQSDGVTMAKSPMGMFNEFEIPNDYEYVRQCIEAFRQGKPQPDYKG